MGKRELKPYSMQKKATRGWSRRPTTTSPFRPAIVTNTPTSPPNEKSRRLQRPPDPDAVTGYKKPAASAGGGPGRRCEIQKTRRLGRRRAPHCPSLVLRRPDPVSVRQPPERLVELVANRQENIHQFRVKVLPRLAFDVRHRVRMAPGLLVRPPRAKRVVHVRDGHQPCFNGDVTLG